MVGGVPLGFGDFAKLHEMHYDPTKISFVHFFNILSLRT